MAPKKTLIQFLVDLADDKNMQKKWERKKNHGKSDQWADLVMDELSGADAALMLEPDENRDAIEAKVNADKKQADIVWTAATVWQ